ncbi:hypothetical protein [Antricoccus suffuscus]|nr:hypothetical protein [Antricoccus suffuscus]
MIQALEEAGHATVLFLHDRFGGDVRHHERIVREGWPDVRSEVVDVAGGIRGVDACIATGWPSAHVLASAGTQAMRRLYFVQDYEPYFYARGSEYALAEDTYRFGFRCIALGRMVGDLLRSEVGVDADVTEFGCDTNVYRHLGPQSRSGVVFYTRPVNARRGYLLGTLALEKFHQRHPEQEIHVYGQKTVDLPFPVTNHGRLTPAQLNELYNKTIAGIAMSFTNISLVAEEMLAAGTIPVVNDSPYARADLPSEFASWAKPTPGAIADALCALVEAEAIEARALQAASSVRGDMWRPAQADVVRIVEDEVYGPPSPELQSIADSGGNNR